MVEFSSPTVYTTVSLINLFKYQIRTQMVLCCVKYELLIFYAITNFPSIQTYVNTTFLT